MEIIFQSPKGEIQDVTELVSEISLEDNINKSCILTLSCLVVAAPMIGTRVRFTHDGVCWFMGVVFRISRGQDGICQLTAYDQLRYLAANESYVIHNETAASAVRRICGDMGLPTGKVAETGHIIVNKVCDDQKMLDIIFDCVQLTAVNTNQLFFLKDVEGKVTLQNIKDNVQDVVLAPDFLLSKYTYEQTIDDDSFNTIKLVQDDSENGKRRQFVIKDSGNIQAWGGVLQYYEKLDEGMNDAQLKERGKALLSLKNRVEQSLSVDLDGDRRVRAGNVIFMELEEIGIRKFLLCTAATHKFTAAFHTIKANFKLV